MSAYKKFTEVYESCNVIHDPTAKKLDNLDEYVDYLGWWIEIFTAQPACTYYFGTFENTETAVAALPGFTKDLLNEGIAGLVARIHFHSPHELTVDLNREEARLNRITHFPSGVDIL